MSIKTKSAAYHPLRAKLIFNAGSGRSEESPQQLASILSEMQDQQILPEVYSVRPDSQLEDVVHNAIKSGIKLIVVAGGDGTIDSILGAMVEGMRPLASFLPAHETTSLLTWGLPEILRILSPYCARVAG